MPSEDGRLSEEEIAERFEKTRRMRAAGMTLGEAAVQDYADELARNPGIEQEWYELAKEMGKSNTEGDYPPPDNRNRR